MKSSEKDSEQTKFKEKNIGKTILFSMGYFFNTYVIVAFNNYVWTYYEGELGLISLISLWPIYMAIANAIFTIWSMISNPLLGYYTDRPLKWTRRIGFHTPWILISGIPIIILFFLLFTPPSVSGPESALPILLYYLLIVCIFDLFNSLFQTHSFGAFAAHFRGDSARRRAGFFTQLFTFLANFIAITIWSQIIDPGNPTTFILAALISSILMGISLIIFIPGSKESDEIKERFIMGYETAEKIPFFQTMKIILKQKNFMLALFTYIAFMIAMGLTSMNAVNFVDDVLQEEQQIRSIGAVLMLIFSLLTMPFWALLAKKIGHSKTYSIGLAVFGLSLLLNLFITNVLEFYLISSFNGVAIAMYMIMLSPVLADCYDEIAVKTKKHHQATLIGIRNIFVRSTLLIQSFIIAIIHAITIYDPNNLIHSNEALLGLRLIQGFFPFIFCITAALIFLKWYDLKGKKKQEMMQKLQEMGL